MGAITLRKLLNGELLDFVNEATVGHVADCPMVCELVSQLADYQEEGKSLFLDVYLVHELDAFLAPVPGNLRLHLGSVSRSEPGIQQALKKAAPLVKGAWTMYLTPSLSAAGLLDFGVFMDSGSLLNVPIETAIRSSDGSTSNYLRVTKVAKDVVHLASHTGSKRTVHFTTGRDEVSRDEDLVQRLANAICANVDASVAQTAASYLSTILARGIRDAHGTLIAVTGATDLSFITDAVLLQEPIDIAGIVKLAKTEPMQLPRLFSIEAVVGGMLGSDGIVVFNSSGQLLAYNWFVEVAQGVETGGARRRAYATLRTLVGGSLTSTFFQSQDGAQDFHTTTE